MRFDEVVDLLGIGALLARRPHTLSGGERQRVAIGRALLAQPHLLLMDEPLASLDAARKAEILPYLARLKTALRLPVIYVTHALDEATRLADFMVLIEAGRVVASGSLPEVAARADLPLAQRDDAGALLLCVVAEHDPARELTRLEGGGASFLVPLARCAGGQCLPHPYPRPRGDPGRPPPRRDQPAQHRTGDGAPDRSGGAALGDLVEIALPTGALLARVTPDAIDAAGVGAGRTSAGADQVHLDRGAGLGLISERFHREWNCRNNLSLRGAQPRGNLLPDEPRCARQAGDCFGAARLAMTVFAPRDRATPQRRNAALDSRCPIG